MVKETNYTKGEWKVACDSYGKVQHSRKDCVFAHDTTFKTAGPTVAHAITNHADAQLISAAPDMYEILKDYVRYQEYGGDIPSLSDAIKILDKAEGK